MRVVVFGAGAVGGHLAARLAAHGSAAGIEVAAVARGAQLEAMNHRGITLWIGEERTSAPIRATDHGLLTAVQEFARAARIATPQLDAITALVIEKARRMGLYPLQG
jgi:2-dehydropantoate 2-reductase